MTANVAKMIPILLTVELLSPFQEHWPQTGFLLILRELTQILLYMLVQPNPLIAGPRKNLLSLPPRIVSKHLLCQDRGALKTSAPG